MQKKYFNSDVSKLKDALLKSVRGFVNAVL